MTCVFSAAVTGAVVLAWTENMKANLEYLRREIVAYLEERNLGVFKSFPCGPELGSDAVYWDSHSNPDYREFIAAGEAAGVRLFTVYGREFGGEIVDEALERLDRLDAKSLAWDDRRSIENRLRDMRAYEGFICEVEISFPYAGRTYVFDQPTPWYEEVSEILDRIEASTESREDENPLSGYYSNN